MVTTTIATTITSSTSIHSAGQARPAGWWAAFTRHGYYGNVAAVVTLVLGIYAHVTRLFIGTDLLLQDVYTPAYDMVLALPMTYAALTGWLTWRRVEHPNRRHQIAYGFLLVYFTASVPLHVQTLVSRRTDYIRAFPEWYSWLILPVMIGLLVLAWRLRYRAMAPANPVASAEDAGDTLPTGRSGRRFDQLAARLRHSDRRILAQVAILACVGLIMLGLLVREAIHGTIGLAWVVVGLLAGAAVGEVASPIKHVQWDEEVRKVVARLDWIGAVILVVYLALMLSRDWVLGHLVHGAALAALGLSVTAGAMGGRAMGTRRAVRAVLRAVGLLAPADSEPGTEERDTRLPG